MCKTLKNTVDFYIFVILYSYFYRGGKSEIFKRLLEETCDNAEHKDGPGTQSQGKSDSWNDIKDFMVKVRFISYSFTRTTLCGSLVTTAWRPLRLRMEERPPDI